MTTFTCEFCGQEHPIEPHIKLSSYRGMEEFYRGDIHMRITKDVLVYDGYTWFRPENTKHYPPNVERIVYEPEGHNPSATIIPAGSYEWFAEHGYLGRWLGTNKTKQAWPREVYLLLKPTDDTKESIAVSRSAIQGHSTKNIE